MRILMIGAMLLLAAGSAMAQALTDDEIDAGNRLCMEHRAPVMMSSRGTGFQEGWEKCVDINELWAKTKAAAVERAKKEKEARDKAALEDLHRRATGR